MNGGSLTIRAAKSEDAQLILQFIHKKAAFDTSMQAFLGTVQTSEEAIRQTLFGAVPYAFVLFAETEAAVVGFALYYFRYSSFKGQPSLWLDDLYVDELARSGGVGAALVRRLAKIAMERECSHLGWTASVNNVRGLKFYQRLGAEVVDQRGNTLFWQVVPEVLSAQVSPPVSM